ncbi:MAG TPA: thiamine phosphate synthase [Candidatus Binataceae bacterium]
MAARVPFRLYLITGSKVIKSGTLIDACAAALSTASEWAPPGAVAIQLREKAMSARELYEVACALRGLCTRAGAMLLINDRIDVALASDADGVHLPASSFAVHDARELLGSNRLVGVSTHRAEEVADAERDGADFAVFGPVFDPISKGAYGPAGGLEGLKAACVSSALPVFALGGINDQRAGLIMASLGAWPAGVAAIGAIFGADDPAAATRAMLSAMGLARSR